MTNLRLVCHLERLAHADWHANDSFELFLSGAVWDTLKRTNHQRCVCRINDARLYLSLYNNKHLVLFYPVLVISMQIDNIMAPSVPAGTRCTITRFYLLLKLHTWDIICDQGTSEQHRLEFSKPAPNKYRLRYLFKDDKINKIELWCFLIAFHVNKGIVIEWILKVTVDCFNLRCKSSNKGEESHF